MTLADFFNGAAITFALMAAALWFYASKVTVQASTGGLGGDPAHPNDNIYVDDEDGLKIVTQLGKDIVDVLKTGRAQSRWNSYAALTAAASAILQALGLKFGC